jgi:hypothetical protein
LKYLHPFLYLLLLIAPEARSAPPSWYEVEVLVFEHLTPNTRASEIIPLESRPLNSERIQEVPSAQTKMPVQDPMADPLPLSPRAWKLTDVGQRLNKSPHYRRLLHQAWRQVAVSPHQAQPVFLHLPSPENTPSEPLDPQLEGTITLSRGRFLHLALDLLYRQPPKAAVLPKPDPDIEIPTPPLLGKHFRLTESRRIRIRELHYFDHPHVGVLVQVRQSDAPGTPQTFPLEATSAQEIPPEEAGKPLRPEE